ncbi:MAG: HD domain-containing phosphohydrolase [Desulfovibrionaceae bacterium]
MSKASKQTYAEDFLLNRILETMVNEVKGYANFQRYHLNKYAEIGMAMSGEEDIDKLLEMIVYEAREITNADAGTLYMVSEDGQSLVFVILQNDSMGTFMGGTSGKAIPLPPVPLFRDGVENHANVSSHVAITGEIVNIHDVYESEEFDFTGPRKYDEATGYRSKSMMVIPMRNHENDIIGVLQLLNALDVDSGETIFFSEEDVGLIAALASQAAVAITKTKLIQDLVGLFNAFITSIATAIEEKSKYTGGHIHRVAELTMDIARKIHEVDYGPFKDVKFTEDQLEEMRVAAWLHDIGKITTPEFVVDKASKLETIFDRVELVKLRFDYIARHIETDFLRHKVALLETGDRDGLASLDAAQTAALAELADEQTFVMECNNPGEFMADEKIARLKEIGHKVYVLDGEEHRYLSDNEIENLSIRKGTLTVDERKIIENHVTMTYKLLQELPFPKKMQGVPLMAATHHEKLDGSGYPWGMKSDDIPFAGKIMAVADIFEALTAADRPYKRPMPLSQAMKILGFMVKDNHIDAQITDLLLQSGVMQEYAGKHLKETQVDIDLAERKLPPKILIVRSPDGLMHDMINALEGWNLSVLTAQNAVQGFNMVEEAKKKNAPFGLVFLSCRLTGLPNAFEAAERLMTDEALAGSAVVLTYPHDDDALRARADAVGAQGLLPMPYTYVELKDAAFTALGKPVPEGDFELDALVRRFQEDSGSGKPVYNFGQKGKPVVLLVDDSVNIRMLVSYYMKNTPYEVVTAENGRDALEKYASGLVDCVVMDTEMPVMDGYEAARTIRAWETAHGRPVRPILAMAPHTVKGDDERRAEAGFTGHVLKPIKKAELTALIAQSLAAAS